jgi:hypothetical protein
MNKYSVMERGKKLLMSQTMERMRLPLSPTPFTMLCKNKTN